MGPNFVVSGRALVGPKNRVWAGPSCFGLHEKNIVAV
jgi:hypothetical protein